MKLKKTLGLCEYDWCFRLSTLDISIQGTLKNGEKQEFIKAKCCKKHTLKMMKELNARAEKYKFNDAKFEKNEVSWHKEN